MTRANPELLAKARRMLGEVASTVDACAFDLDGATVLDVEDVLDELRAMRELLVKAEAQLTIAAVGGIAERVEL